MAASEEYKIEVKENVLYVKDFPDDYVDNGLKRLFSLYGNVIDLKLLPNRDPARGPVALVAYDTVKAANDAIDALNGVYIRRLQLKLNISKAKRKVRESLNSVNNSFDCQLSSASASGIAEHKVNALKRMVSLRNLNQLSREMVEPKQSVDNVVSTTTIEDFYREGGLLLYEIFDCLTLKEKFGLQRVCKLFAITIKEMIASETTLTFGLKPSIGCSDWTHRSNEYNDVTAAITQPDGRVVFKDCEILAPIIRPMVSIECLHFADCSVHTIELKWVLNQCPNLKCLRLDCVQGIGKRDWPKFAKPLSTKLIHFTFAGNTLNDWNSLSRMVESFALLEELIVIDCLQDMNQVFRALNQSLKKVSIIRCDRFGRNSIEGLNRSNAPNITHLDIDFAVNEDCLSTIKSIYSILTDLVYIRAVNVQNENITQLVHDLNSNELSIVFSDFVDFSHPIIICAVNRGLVSLQITGSINPIDLEEFSNRFPDCEELKLIDCKFFCDCSLKRSQLLSDRYYSCRQCLERIKEILFIESTLSHINFNGEEYDKENDSQ